MRRRGPLLLLLFAAVVLMVAAGLIRWDDDPPAAAPPGAPAVAGAEGRAAAVLAGWDARRAAAWEAADAAALRQAYAPGSSAAVADVRLLRRWTAAGWEVRDLATQVLALQVHEERADLWRLEVTDRLSGGVIARGDDVRPLPTGAPVTRELELRLRDGVWVLASSRRT